MATFKKETNITTAITLLSDLIRAAIDTSEYLIPFSTELTYLSKYIEIQNIRYKNKFNIHWDIPEDTMALKVFKFSLQPIVENSIVHGIIPSDKTGDIYVSAKIQNNNLQITVKDNGVGMSYARLCEVRNKINSNILEKNSSIGISNTNQRIKIIFGDNFGCYINSDENGTTVDIIMPIIENEE